MAQHFRYRLPMSLNNLETLRRLCRDQEAFLQLKQFLEEREILYQQFSTQIAQQMQKNQELEAQQQSAEVASQAKSQFLAMMSHELRTPLNSILGLSTILGQQMIGDLNPKQMEYIDCIRESGEHLLALISDILDLSKVEAGRERLALASVDVASLCESCMAMVEPRASAKGLQLTHGVEADANHCVADARRLRQMLLNLLSNAVKFTHTGEVALRVRRQGSMLQFEVEDTGIGIPAERRGQLFQPFTQLDSNLNRHYEGTGLGLALTQQLAQLHGGYLTVESEVNQGSRFLLYLPMDAHQGGTFRASDSSSNFGHPPVFDSAASPACPIQRPTSQAMPPTILLMDACPDRQQALIAYVQACGWSMATVETWDDLYSRVAEHLPRLVILGDLGLSDPGSGNPGSGDLDWSAPGLGDPASDGSGLDKQKHVMTQHLATLRGLPQAQDIKIVACRESDAPADPCPGVDAYLVLPMTLPKLERMLWLLNDPG